jgi:hypothetical protein
VPATSDRYERLVANAIAGRDAAGRQKRSCGPRQPDARDWAKAQALRSASAAYPSLLDPRKFGSEKCRRREAKAAVARRSIGTVAARPLGGFLTLLDRTRI